MTRKKATGPLTADVPSDTLPSLPPSDSSLQDLLSFAGQHNIEVPPLYKDPGMEEALQLLISRSLREEDAQFADAKAHAKQVHEEMFERTAQLDLNLSPMPTSMCRISPYFPLQKKELTKRKHLDKFIIGSGSWGTLIYSGFQLSIYDEDYLLAILALIRKKRATTTTDGSGSVSLKFKGRRSEILRACGQSDGSINYKRLDQGLHLMQSCTITLQRPVNEDSKTKRKKYKWDRDNILTHVSMDEKTDEITIVVNPYFYQTYMADDYTLLDLDRRSKIKGIVAKSLYRFVMSHQTSLTPKPWKVETLVEVLNLNEQLPRRRHREQIRGAIKELIAQDILLKDSRLDKDDLVWLIKHPVKSKPGILEKKKAITA